MTALIAIWEHVNVCRYSWVDFLVIIFLVSSIEYFIKKYRNKNKENKPEPIKLKTKKEKIEDVLYWMDEDIKTNLNLDWRYTLTLRSYNGTIEECDTHLEFLPEYSRVSNFRANTDPDRSRELYIASEVIRLVEDDIATKESFRVTAEFFDRDAMVFVEEL